VKVKNILLILFAIVAGMIIGYFVPWLSALSKHNHVPSNIVASSPQIQADQNKPKGESYKSKIEELQSKIKALEEENKQLHVQASNPKEVGNPLPSTLIQANIRDEKGNIHRDLIQLLQLSPEEQSKMNELFSKRRFRVTQVLQAKVITLESSPTRVALKIPNSTEDRKAIQKEFYEEARQILGAERFELFQDLYERDYHVDDSRLFGENTLYFTINDNVFLIEQIRTNGRSSSSYPINYDSSISLGKYEIFRPWLTSLTSTIKLQESPLNLTIKILEP
jgi:hypothetical protein